MSHVWSEYNKVVNFDPPASQWGSTGATQGDIVDMEAYKKCTFLIMTGASSTGAGKVTVQAGVDNSTCATDIIFKYRSIIATDVYGALTSATTTGFAITGATANQYHIIEVDASTVAAATTGFDHCALSVTNQNVATMVCVVAILSEPRYPQGILETALG